ncbi:MAG TPA: DEAD/DEAH box helicase family protein [Sphingomicrobium sp.]|nr:DEAD/DEAH box helicase family protein [Sphingomicrobium sp.]
MRIQLFEFQKQALHELRIRLDAARRLSSTNNPQAITLAAPTGSGKTVIMTALFEAILDAPDDQLDWPVDWHPLYDAAILWVSDMPELNEQTKRKIESQSDKIFRASQLITIDADFDYERLEGGKVYFLNTQKLASDRRLSRVGDNRTWSIWHTLRNTSEAMPDRFFVVIDEAHRGMSTARRTEEAQSIVQRFIKGHAESGMVKMPLILGLSATPRRFNDLLADTSHTVHRVQVPAEEVRLSGLLKERILIHHPGAPTRAEMGLLSEASRRFVEMQQQWGTYCSEEGERVVRPILVIQVEDGGANHVTRTNLAAAISTIEEAIGRRLDDSEIAHALQEDGRVAAGDRRIRKIDASRIEDDPDVSVVFFKMALSTGWDCPRAEVMMSFRRAQDHTYIAQLLGRMVRTPLARRVERLAQLNDVHLFLPYFDEDAVTAVIRALQNTEEVPPAEAADARELVVLNRRQDAAPIFEAIQQLITYRVGAHRVQSSVRRYQEIARRLTLDEIDPEAWDRAKADAVTWIGDQAAILRESEVLDRTITELTTVAVNTVAVENVTGDQEAVQEYEIQASTIDIERMFEEAGRSLGNGLHREYWRAHAERDAEEVKLELIVVARDATANAALERQSRAAFNNLYDEYRSEFPRLAEHKRLAYDRLRAASTIPEPLTWTMPDSIESRRSTDARTWQKHIFVEDDGRFLSNLGPWEEAVLSEELSREDVVGWLRNLDRKPWSLEVPYITAGKAKPMFPDFLIVRADASGYLFDVLEPHDPSLSDNLDKAKGLSTFAERHGDTYSRIQLIRVDGRGLSRLEFNRSVVRDRVALITTSAELDSLFVEFR